MPIARIGVILRFVFLPFSKFKMNVMNDDEDEEDRNSEFALFFMKNDQLL